MVNRKVGRHTIRTRARYPADDPIWRMSYGPGPNDPLRALLARMDDSAHAAARYERATCPQPDEHRPVNALGEYID